MVVVVGLARWGIRRVFGGGFVVFVQEIRRSIMRAARVCFLLTAATALFAVGLAFAQTTYDNMVCYPTPGPSCCVCGCPVPATPSDICQADFNMIGQNQQLTWYYCVTLENQDCTAPSSVLYCGTNVWNCPCQPCNAPADPGCTQSQCQPTTKRFCTGYFGCH